ncbi:MAG: double-strand break repair helicase AddA, partial [Rhizobiales bacterium]|nr:double-strand break repair helicase AddA [Hyphomicrobiales bacterium]
ASDPASSAWVIANAGSGKTHVLTQRVVRLLLAGVDPDAILCLTFTKVAAAEMSRRIFGHLGRWTMMPEAELHAAILDLQGRPATGPQLRQARRLFARALETPGGLKIQTIHAFCERLLHQFPFEANVPGQFAVLDDTSAAALIASARARVMAEAAREPEGRLGAAMRYLAENATDFAIREALDCVVAEREAIRRWIAMSAGDEGAGSIDDALADLRRRLGLLPGETGESICREICLAAGWGRQDCGKLAEALAESLAQAPHSTNERARARLLAVLGAEHHGAEAEARLDLFLHLEPDKSYRGYEANHRFRSHRFGADFGRANADLLDRFETESERLLALTRKHIAARNFAATEALLVVADAILQAYAAAKRRSGALDFGDLIVKARNLLSRSDAAEWVLYKLDRRIDHILVDEAQDTSPDQWAVVQAIAADFFAGETAADGRRTIFAVGDDKQSIFGFQGAAPHMLAEMQRFFGRKIADAERSFIERPLFLSFRSTQEVLGAVDQVFRGREAEVTAAAYEAHAARRHGEPGKVVVLPRIVRQVAEEPEDWTAPFDAPTAAEVALADRIAQEIGTLIGTTLPSGKQVAPGGILILARKRDAFFSAMNRALRRHAIRAAGADRIPVATHIAVLDLLALADVMLLPEDDLQLAACLKSPLIGLGEDELMRLAAGRRGSLWAALGASRDEPFRRAAERLAAWRAFADRVTPFRFFATILGPDSGRRAFRARLGGEADDVLDAFLSQALSYEAIEAPSLGGFAAFIRASRSEIKREAEERSEGVRLMTVHGAKGLEADIVFLVDTGGQIVVSSHRKILVPFGDGRDSPAFLWRRSGRDVTELQRKADLAADAETRREYLRLLYVAMTRARDVLYVCGIRPEKKEVEGCWYSLAANALVPDEAERDAETGELAGPYIWPQPERPPVPAKAGERRGGEPPVHIPPWLSESAPSPARPPEPLRPSRALAEPDPPAIAGSRLEGDATASGDLALLRGRLVHRLLQALPGAPEERRRAHAGHLLAAELIAHPELFEDVWREVGAVLAEPALRDNFGPNSRAEVAIVGQVARAGGDYAVSGQIDRLVRTPDGWRILDFKTARVVPETADLAPPGYVLQLALYRRLLTEMRPGAEIEAALVWTAAPKIMPIPARSMEQALAKLGIKAFAFP